MARHISWGHEVTFASDHSDKQPLALMVSPIYFGPGRPLKESGFINEEMHDQFYRNIEEYRKERPRKPYLTRAEAEKKVKKKVKKANKMWHKLGADRIEDSKNKKSNVVDEEQLLNESAYEKIKAMHREFMNNNDDVPLHLALLPLPPPPHAAMQSFAKEWRETVLFFWSDLLQEEKTRSREA
jgi:hypothetical protein